MAFCPQRAGVTSSREAPTGACDLFGRFGSILTCAGFLAADFISLHLVVFVLVNLVELPVKLLGFGQGTVHVEQDCLEHSHTHSRGPAGHLHEDVVQEEDFVTTIK